MKEPEVRNLLISSRVTTVQMALTTLAMVALLILSFRSVNAEVLSLTDDDKQSVIDIHNRVRIAAGAAAMQKVKWNDDLAQFAQRSASQCNFEHSNYDSRQGVAGFSYIGENIYTSTGNDQKTIKDAVKDWADEKKDYDLNTNQCSASTCLHYTQLVWASTTDVGCAIGKCNSVQGFNSEPGYLIFCNYGVGGNNGEKPYEKASSGEIGSKCREKFNVAADSAGLCG